MIFGDERLPPRLWSKITVDADGHWIWTGAIAGGPQIRWKVEGCWKTVSVRRLLFELEHGPITAEAVGGCGERCVNPSHAIAGTVVEVSTHWAEVHRATVCQRGHDLAVFGAPRMVNGRKVNHCRLCVALKQKRENDRRYVRRLVRMSPERRASFVRRSMAIRKAWRTGARRCRDGSVSALAIVAAEASSS